MSRKAPPFIRQSSELSNDRIRTRNGVIYTDSESETPPAKRRRITSPANDEAVQKMLSDKDDSLRDISMESETYRHIVGERIVSSGSGHTANSGSGTPNAQLLSPIKKALGTIDRNIPSIRGTADPTPETGSLFDASSPKPAPVKKRRHAKKTGENTVTLFSSTPRDDPIRQRKPKKALTSSSSPSNTVERALSPRKIGPGFRIDEPIEILDSDSDTPQVTEPRLASLVQQLPKPSHNGEPITITNSGSSRSKTNGSRSASVKQPPTIAGPNVPAQDTAQSTIVAKYKERHRAKLELPPLVLFTEDAAMVEEATDCVHKYLGRHGKRLPSHIKPIEYLKLMNNPTGFLIAVDRMNRGEITMPELIALCHPMRRIDLKVACYYLCAIEGPMEKIPPLIEAIGDWTLHRRDISKALKSLFERCPDLKSIILGYIGTTEDLPNRNATDARSLNDENPRAAILAQKIFAGATGLKEYSVLNFTETEAFVNGERSMVEGGRTTSIVRLPIYEHRMLSPPMRVFAEDVLIALIKNLRLNASVGGEHLGAFIPEAFMQMVSGCITPGASRHFTMLYAQSEDRKSNQPSNSAIRLLGLISVLDPSVPEGPRRIAVPAIEKDNTDLKNRKGGTVSKLPKGWPKLNKEDTVLLVVGANTAVTVWELYGAPGTPVPPVYTPASIVIDSQERLVYFINERCRYGEIDPMDTLMTRYGVALFLALASTASQFTPGTTTRQIVERALLNDMTRRIFDRLIPFSVRELYEAQLLVKFTRVIQTVFERWTGRILEILEVWDEDKDFNDIPEADWAVFGRSGFMADVIAEGRSLLGVKTLTTLAPSSIDSRDDGIVIPADDFGKSFSINTALPGIPGHEKWPTDGTGYIKLEPHWKPKQPTPVRLHVDPITGSLFAMKSDGTPFDNGSDYYIWTMVQCLTVNGLGAHQGLWIRMTQQLSVRALDPLEYDYLHIMRLSEASRGQLSDSRILLTFNLAKLQSMGPLGAPVVYTYKPSFKSINIGGCYNPIGSTRDDIVQVREMPVGILETTKYGRDLIKWPGPDKGFSICHHEGYWRLAFFERGTDTGFRWRFAELSEWKQETGGGRSESWPRKLETTNLFKEHIGQLSRVNSVTAAATASASTSATSLIPLSILPNDSTASSAQAPVDKRQECGYCHEKGHKFSKKCTKLQNDFELWQKGELKDEEGNKIELSEKALIAVGHIPRPSKPAKKAKKSKTPEPSATE